VFLRVSALRERSQADPCCFDDQCILRGRLIAVLSRVRSQSFFWSSDCTPKHLFVDPAPACEESPDLDGRHVNIVMRPPCGQGSSQSNRRRGRQVANSWIHCPTRTEPSPQESLPMAATNTIVISQIA
jgi:hypothetical protein